MIIGKEKHEVEMSGFEDNETQGFKIKQDARSFELLSSVIYSDKISAVIREYSCNALDSHIAAGKPDLPFTVHLPNVFEPWFSVKDYGVGLDHHEVMNLYSTYFESTKAQSNNFVGAFGLGSKSAFAYTDQFTITAVYNGTVRNYSAYVNEDGEPVIMLLSEELTDEGNGVEIFMAVGESDFSDFLERAAKIYYRFPVLPEITGNILDLPVVKYIIDKPEYKLRDRNSRYDDQKSYAIQGPVAYPIDAESLSDLSQEDKNILTHTPFDIHFPIGALSVAASRERLNYNKLTKAAIGKALEKIKLSAKDEFSGIFDECETLYEAKLKWNNWFEENSFSNNREFKNLIRQNMFYKGEPVENGSLIFKTYENIDFTLYSALGEGLRTLDMVVEDTLTGTRFLNEYKKYLAADWDDQILFYSYYESQPAIRSNKIEITINNELKIVFVDTEYKDRRALNEAIWHNIYKSAGGDYHRVIVVKPAEGMAEELQKFWYDCPVIYTSSFQEVPENKFEHLYKSVAQKRREVRDVKPTVKMYKIGQFTSFGDHAGIPDVVVDTNVPNYYFVTYRNEPVTPGTDKVTNSGTLNSILYSADRLGILKDIKSNIYMINYSQVSVLKDYKNFNCIYEYIKLKTNELLEDKSFLRAIANNFSAVTHYEQTLLFLEGYSEKLKGFHDDLNKKSTPLAKFLNSTLLDFAKINTTLQIEEKFKLSQNKSGYLKNLINGDFYDRSKYAKHVEFFNKQLKLSEEKILKDIKQFDKDYPLFNYLLKSTQYYNKNYRTQSLDQYDLISYINSMDIANTVTKREIKKKLNKEIKEK